MKYLISGLMLLLVATKGYTQKTEPLIAKIYYQFTHKYDKADTTIKVQKDVVLMAGATNSKFANAKSDFSGPIPDYILNPPLIKPDMSNVDWNKGSKVNMIIETKLAMIESWYRLPEQSKMVVLGIIGYKDFKAEMPAPVINWEIKDEYREISNLQCQKAEGDFGGRHYIAWFAPSLPLPYGPWKLGGLPGIILEATDSRNEVKFIFKRMTEVKDWEVVFYEELRPTKLSEAAYYKVVDKFYKDPVAFSKSQLNKNDEVVDIMFEDIDGNTLKGTEAMEAIKEDSKIKITNPLELKKQ